ncbi:ABC transporter permease subunit [Blautia coccoides]|uniref:ABC transporter permease n=1 Tax=Blautia producta TaxID=33035 RepID=UPI00214A1D2C|nr:ABC transporter permease subunit [Blautia coccoides]MCR1989093.1 ABC transporter permease subunit [Blautia coccoides]MDU5219226.1 ABC transporter permease subunit [Blautia producta]MDU5380787.1 ABC transporter permease subunit [Blautia producta]MDU6882111.1 ABC transporter permease subunit [Blautia producta]
MKKAKFKRWAPLYLMMAPGLIYLFINNYMPMAGLVVAFKNYNAVDGIFNSPWSGFSNFTYLFNDAWTITRNTLLYNIAFIIINLILGVMFAIFICDIKSKKCKTLYQSAILLPFLMSIVIVSYITFAFFSGENGMLNKTILPMMGKDAVSWYTEPKYWPVILVIVNTWKGVGYGCLIYISSIAGIDPSYFEAAELDGATKWKQIRYITIPSIMPSIITLTLLNIGRIFYSDFGLFYQVTQNSGQLYEATNVIDTYVYRALLQSGNIGMASAAGFYQSIVGFVCVLAANMVVKKLSPENAMF